MLFFYSMLFFLIYNVSRLKGFSSISKPSLIRFSSSSSSRLSLKERISLPLSIQDQQISPSSSIPSPFTVGQNVNVTVISFSTMGATVSINRGHDRALVTQREINVFRASRNNMDVEVGELLEGHIQHIRDDGKMYVQLRPKPVERIPQLMEKVKAKFQQFPDDILPVGDKSSADDIMYFMGMTKKDFKMAVGGLYKAGIVQPGAYETRLNTETDIEKPQPKK